MEFTGQSIQSPVDAPNERARQTGALSLSLSNGECPYENRRRLIIGKIMRKRNEFLECKDNLNECERASERLGKWTTNNVCNKNKKAGQSKTFCNENSVVRPFSTSHCAPYSSSQCPVYGLLNRSRSHPHNMHCVRFK